VTSDIVVSLPVATLIAGTAACLVWTVRILWQLDRRVLRVETHLNIDAKESTP
jgi:hypothetical protein